MAIPAVSTGFGDLLDPRFQEVFWEEFDDTPSMRDRLYTMPADNGRADMRWSQVADFTDWSQFSGSVTYQGLSQGYDTTATHVEFTSGFQIERKLYDDDQYDIMEDAPRGLATAAARTREAHAARPLNNAFSVDTFFYNNSEAVAMCSNSHTSASGASTASGFDNLITSALSATALTAARKQHVQLRSDNANRIMIVPDELWIPVDLYDVAYEIVASMGKVDDATNNRNVHEGAYTVNEWIYLNDANNWFLMDSKLRKRSLYWVDRVAMEFAYAEDMDTIVAKWRGYMRYANAHRDWRFVLGAQVS